MLATVNLDDQLGAMTGEIGNEVPDRHLATEMRIRKILPKEPPDHFLGIRGVAA